MSAEDDPPPLDLRPLPGSERPPMPGAAAPATPLPAGVPIEVTVVVRRRAGAPTPNAATVLTPAELAASYGADPVDVELVGTTLTALGAQVLSANPATRLVRVSGPAGRLSRIFGTTLEQVTSEGPAGAPVTHRRRTGGLSVPSALAGVVTAVLGLDDRPQARAHVRIAPAAAVARSYSPPELGRVYRFPTGTDGAEPVGKRSAPSRPGSGATRRRYGSSRGNRVSVAKPVRGLPALHPEVQDEPDSPGDPCSGRPRVSTPSLLRDSSAQFASAAGLTLVSVLACGGGRCRDRLLCGHHRGVGLRRSGRDLLSE